MGAPELNLSPPRQLPEAETMPGNFVCPNCGYIQRRPTPI
jgi:predicted RNA-binding Zn-ribbon protein involved in translation (DUF1610 family)